MSNFKKIKLTICSSKEENTKKIITFYNKVKIQREVITLQGLYLMALGNVFQFLIVSICFCSFSTGLCNPRPAEPFSPARCNYEGIKFCPARNKQY